jgi:hypothetical protein
VSPLDAKILRGIDEHAAELDARKIRLGDPLGADSPVVNATKQIFRTVLGDELGLRISAFDQDEKEEAAELQVDRSEDERVQALSEILDLFAELCDRWPEVLDLRYGGTRADFREFRTRFLPALLEALDVWADERTDRPLKDELIKLERRYGEAIGGATRAQRESGVDDEDDE